MKKSDIKTLKTLIYLYEVYCFGSSTVNTDSIRVFCTNSLMEIKIDRFLSTQYNKTAY